MLLLILLVDDKVLKIVLSLRNSVDLNINLTSLVALSLFLLILVSVDEKNCSLLLYFLMKDKNDDCDWLQ